MDSDPAVLAAFDEIFGQTLKPLGFVRPGIKLPYYMRPVDDMGTIGLVYTRVEERRKHYAEHLVYQVTMIAKDKGLIPMLYTDADYVASNACYEKIGFVLRGKLCTIGKA